MRIACYGFVEKDAGSVASGNFVLLEALLERGHQIDFYAKSNFVRPEALFAREGFTYLGKAPNWEDPLHRILPRFLHPITSHFFYTRTLNQLARWMAENHRKQPYDVLLFMGTWAPFRIAGLPTVSWPQGPPQTEWEAIYRLRKTIIRLCGYGLYARLKAYYAYRNREVLRQIPLNDAIILGSRWSREALARCGFPLERSYALPYPIDLERFQPHPRRKEAAERPRVLWLGRLDPRKRLDLFLEAGQILIETGFPVQLEVIGRPNYARGYLKLIEHFPYPEYLTYHPFIPRAEVPDLLRRTDVLVQPSEHENFGSSVAEALACGTPVVVGPTNGTADYIGKGGICFDTYTPVAVAEAIRKAVPRSSIQWNRAIEYGRMAAERHFAPRRIAHRLEAILDAIREVRTQRSAA